MQGPDIYLFTMATPRSLYADFGAAGGAPSTPGERWRNHPIFTPSITPDAMPPPPPPGLPPDLQFRMDTGVASPAEIVLGMSIMQRDLERNRRAKPSASSNRREEARRPETFSASSTQRV